MSEEILKALMQLFALIIKQDGGMLSDERDYVFKFLRKQLSSDSVNEYLNLFDDNVGPMRDSDAATEDKAPSVKDSVQILSICKKINRTLLQTQKVVVLMRLYELVNAGQRFTRQRMNIINTVSDVFRIDQSEFMSIERFVKHKSEEDPGDSSIYVLKQITACSECEEGRDETDSTMVFLRIASVDLYFVKYYSENQLFLNGLPLETGKIFTIAKGSSLKYQHGQPIYYSDIASHFMAGDKRNRLTLVAENLNYVFPSGHVGISNIDISEEDGRLVGIMGSSGTGKTTLMNNLIGSIKPTSGSVRINGIDIHSGMDDLEGIVGYVPQDDLLIEDLTVFENLYYAASLCFKGKKKNELTEMVDKTLMSLGLFEKRDLKVGSPLNKVISGGQRKRLNIALELIREPSIMYLDEPTSGLSSRDSENVLDLLRELTFKGKLIFSIIHQPSSEIFKMFDSMIILDQGGEMIYYGNPVEALIHFKTLDAQIDSNIGECPTCGNINPENIFNIVETEVVDEFGKATGRRKTSPVEWAARFRQARKIRREIEEISEEPPSALQQPGPFRQFIIFAIRDIRSKLANRQYILLTLLEAPLLGFILSYIIRYSADPSAREYIFRENENIPIYIFMSLIVALFLGLITSAEEIFKDRKILSRERFLNLSRGSYLLSKVMILLLISAGQSLMFVAIANPILGIKGMFLQYWLALFTTSATANIIGLNISSAFNSAITIYIVVPLLMIPMMVLSGAMFPFDKLNRSLGGVDKTPAIADVMPTKWTYEALMVSQFKDNDYGKLYYETQQQIKIAEFNIDYRLDDLKDSLNRTVQSHRHRTLSDEHPASLKLIRNELQKIAKELNIEEFKNIDDLKPDRFNHIIAEAADNYIDDIINRYRNISDAADLKWDSFYSANRELLDDMYDDYHNQKLEEIVRKIAEPNKILEYKDNFIQNVEPIYLDPVGDHFPAFRSHFLAPTKVVFATRLDTFTFNIAIVWIMTIVFYLLLYFDVLKKIVNSLISN